MPLYRNGNKHTRRQKFGRAEPFYFNQHMTSKGYDNYSLLVRLGFFIVQ
jgi:hypothetical protein